MSLQLTQTHSFLWLSKIPFYIYITVNYLPIHVDGHLGCFHVLGSIKSAAIYIEVHVSFWIMVFSGYMPNSGTAGSYGSFLRNPQNVLHSWLSQFTFPPTVQEHSLSPHPLQHLLFVHFLMMTPLILCKVIPHHNFYFFL